MGRKDFGKKEYVEKEIKKKMFFSGKIYIDRLYQLLEDNKYLVFFSFFQIVVIIILILGYFNLTNKIKIQIELPPKLYQTGTLYVGSQKANKLYYQVWGEYVINKLSNYSPYNIRENLKKISYMFDPQKLVKIKSKFFELEQETIDNLITHTFIPIKKEVKKDGIFYEEGIGKSVLGNNLSITYENCKYQVKFKIDDYHLFIEGLLIDCKPITKDKYDEFLTKFQKEKKLEKRKKIIELEKQLKENK